MRAEPGLLRLVRHSAWLSLLRPPGSFDLMQIRPVANVPHEVQPERDCLFRWRRRQNPEIGRLAIRKDKRRRAEYAKPFSAGDVIVLDLREQPSVFEVGREARRDRVELVTRPRRASTVCRDPALPRV